MPYYGQQRGDYATYGYGRGDPGFLSSLWKGIKKVAAPIIGFAVAGPLGAAVGRAATMKPTPPIMTQRMAPQPRQQIALRAGPIAARSTDYYPPVPQFAGTPMARARATGMENLGAGGTGCCPRGYHLAKDGSGRCVRNRRMNIANPKALRRSMRRVQGFEKLARRTISFTKRVRIKK